MVKGWRNEGFRHSMAKRQIRTTKSNNITTIKNENKINAIENIMNMIKNLPIEEKIKFHDIYCKKHKLVFISEPTIMISLSQGVYTPYWLIPGEGEAEHNSPLVKTAVSEKHYLNSVMKNLKKLLKQKEIQIYLDPDWEKEYLETAEDRRLVQSIQKGARYNSETGRIEGFD